ncbi:MAG: hypothetical protein NVS9B4_12590 [Candidatus Acidiferrum sp.]
MSSPPENIFVRYTVDALEPLRPKRASILLQLVQGNRCRLTPQPLMIRPTTVDLPRTGIGIPLRGDSYEISHH